MNDKNIIGAIVVLLIVVGGTLFIVSGSGKTSGGNTPNGEAAELAQCLTDNGAKFYGAFWCPHCKKQKELFGSAEKMLPYVECSTPNGKEQTAICKEKGITGYPTWTFSDGSQLSGTQTFADLAAKSGCTIASVRAPSTSIEVSPGEIKPGI